MKAAPRSDRNSLSPRVVGMPRMPMRSASGRRIASTVMTASRQPITAKKIAVGHVQAIQETLTSLEPSSNPTQGEALGDVVAHEPYHESAGEDRQDPGRGEQAPIHTGGGYRAGHGGRDRLGADTGERARQQKFDPGEHETEEGRDADAGGYQRHEDLHEKAWERITVNAGRLINLPRHARHEPLKNPNRERHIEQAMGECHRPWRVEEADRRIKIEERQREHRR